MLPIRTGSAAKHTQDYARHGNSTLFAELDIANGNVSAATHGTSGGSSSPALTRGPLEASYAVGSGRERNARQAPPRLAFSAAGQDRHPVLRRGR